MRSPAGPWGAQILTVSSGHFAKCMEMCTADILSGDRDQEDITSTLRAQWKTCSSREVPACAPARVVREAKRQARPVRGRIQRWDG